MLDAVAINDRGTLVVEAAPDSRDLTTASTNAVDLGPDFGPWYIASGTTIAWERPFETIRQLIWIPDNPDDPEPGEGRWDLVEPGSHVPHAAALAVLGLSAPLPDGLRTRWLNEPANNGDCRGELWLESPGWVVLELGDERLSWGGPADFNVDGSVDAFDFLAFQNAFVAGDMACDFDRDGVLGFFDFLAFMGAF
jgi:hypothetical protein